MMVVPLIAVKLFQHTVNKSTRIDDQDLNEGEGVDHVDLSDHNVFMNYFYFYIKVDSKHIMPMDAKNF